MMSLNVKEGRVGFFPADAFDSGRRRVVHRPHLSGSKMNGAADPALPVARMPPPTHWRMAEAKKVARPPRRQETDTKRRAVREF
jgi:hypothetical protein